MLRYSVEPVPPSKSLRFIKGPSLCTKLWKEFHKQQRVREKHDILPYMVYQKWPTECAAMFLQIQRDRLRQVNSRSETGANNRSSRGLVRIRTGNAPGLCMEGGSTVLRSRLQDSSAIPQNQRKRNPGPEAPYSRIT